MTSTTFFFVFIPILAIILLAINLIFAPHNPYQEKESTFECGFHSFLGQNRTQFAISFFIFALLFLLFDLEILLVYPYVVSAYANDIYGLVVMLIFFLALTLGFVFEFGKGALKIDSRQMLTIIYRNSTSTLSQHSGFKSVFSYLFKYFTFERIVVSFICLTLIALLRFAFYGGFFTNPLNLVEAFTIGIPAIFIKLGVQGLVDWVFQDLGFKTWLLDIFNGWPPKANRLSIGDSTNLSYSYDINKKPWKDLYNAKGSDDGELEDKSIGDSPSPTPSEAELSDDVPSLVGSREPSPRRSPSPPVLFDHFNTPITVSTLVEIIKAQEEGFYHHKALTLKSKAMLEIFNKAITALDKPVLDRTPQDIEALTRATDITMDERGTEGTELRNRFILNRDNHLNSTNLNYARAEECNEKSLFYQRQFAVIFDKVKAEVAADAAVSTPAEQVAAARASISSEPTNSWSQMKLTYTKGELIRKMKGEIERRAAEAAIKTAEAAEAAEAAKVAEATDSTAQPSTSTDNQSEGKGKAKDESN